MVMRKSLLEILACPIDKHSPLELYEINTHQAKEFDSGIRSENEQSLKETDSKKLLDFYSEDVILSIGNLAKNSRNAKYKRVAETTILRSES